MKASVIDGLGLLSLQGEPPEFDFSFLIYAAAILLPLLLRLGSSIFRGIAKLLGIELPEPPPEPAGSGQGQGPQPRVEGPFEQELLEAEAASEEEYPVFEELPPQPQASARPAPAPPKRTVAVSSLPQTFPQRTPEFQTLEPRLTSEFKHQTPPAGIGVALAAEPSFVPPATPADWRRAIVLQEILAPPLSLRKEHRPGELVPFDIV